MAFEIGTIKNETHIVSESESAAKVGSGLVDVYATPSLIALCEKVCSDLVKPWLEQGQVTVGTEINIKHLAASKIGTEVKCIAQLISVDGRKLSFRIVAYEKEKMIALGNHTRCIVDKQRFLDKLK